MKELQASVFEFGKTVCTAVAWVFHQSQLYGRMAKSKPLLNKAHGYGLPEGTWQTMTSAGFMFYGEGLWSDETKIELFGHQAKRHCT